MFGEINLKEAFVSNDACLYLFEPCKDWSLCKRNISDAEFEVISKRTSSCVVQQAISKKTDLVPNDYEGGLKTWECSFDLVDYLMTMKDDLHNLKVLEVGCGSGLPGILCLKSGSSVDFQDFNPQVLEAVTIPNVYVNCYKHLTDQELESFKNGVIDVEIAPASSFQKIESRFYYGPWNSNAISDQFDLILTSETIYNPENYKSLLDLFDRCLLPDGVVYVHYNF